jgi:magnesium-transporting ATPase (P-type)
MPKLCDAHPINLKIWALAKEDWNNKQINESALTGGSVLVEKSTRALSEKTILAERMNMAYAGTLMTYGQGEGIVVATGNKTKTGRIAHLISEVVELQTLLTRRIAKFSQLLHFAILVLAGLTL